jgi:hypothetical protein
MTLADRIRSFENLGEKLRRYQENSTEADLASLVAASRKAFIHNPWFTPDFISLSLNNLGKLLTVENLNRWISEYRTKLERKEAPKKIGVVMAGNIPAVGFHDFLCVLISGNTLVAKLSSSDEHLLPAMANILAEQIPEWNDSISFTNGKLGEFDAIIATGSTNTSRYFEFYFGKYPHIIRKSRNSVAVLNGTETDNDLQNLADDIMLYFGMGCRSISKIYVPSGYDFSRLYKALDKYDSYIHHHKYCNNYEYSKSIFMVGQIPFADTGYLLLKEDKAISSRIAVLHYEFYDSLPYVVESILQAGDSVQCIISNKVLPINFLHPGEGQTPALWDYADQTDTLEFLLSLT